MIKDEYGNRRFYGLYRGVVVDNKDPLNQQRLKLRVPQVLHDHVSDWAWTVNQPGVARNIPKVGTGIWVAFEGGDPSFPLWVGTFTPAIIGEFPTTSLNYGSFEGITTHGISSNTPTSLILNLVDEANNFRLSDYTRYPISAQTISTGTEYNSSTGITKITVGTVSNVKANIQPGEHVIISGLQPSTYNDTWVAQAGSSNEYLYIKTGSNLGSITDGGLVTKGTKVYVDVSGTFNIQFSLQATCADTANRDLYVWLSKNGIAVDEAAGIITLPAKGSAAYSSTIAGWNYVITFNEGDYFQIFAEAETAAAATVFARALAAGTRNGLAISIQTITTGTQYNSSTGLTRLTLGTSSTFTVGEVAYISGVEPIEYNGAWTVETGTSGTNLYIKTGSNLGSITNAGTVSEIPGIPALAVTVTQVK